MGLQFGGYVLEAPRVGQRNAAFTWTPDNYIADQSAFDVAYPQDQSVPRTDYLVVVLQDGDLTDAVFGWTKNEELSRFDYQGQQGAFLPLPGGPPDEVGVLTTDANTTRLSVLAPQLSDLGSYPVRMGLGALPGTTFTVALVLNDSLLNNPSPAMGTVQISQESGALGWAPSDLLTYAGLDVWFQRQTFFKFDDQMTLGEIEEALVLNPLPATGQHPQIRIGFQPYLTAVEVTSFGSPTSGTVEWDRNTGQLNFNTSDITSNPGAPVYYDGVLLAVDLTVQISNHGTVGSPGSVSLPLPPYASDVYFRAVGVLSTQFSETVRSDTAVTPKRGQVVLLDSGALSTSSVDQSVYGSSTLQMVVPDLTVERGLKLRLFRSPGDPGATDPSIKDVSSLYFTENAVLADPIIASPQVVLPQTPLDNISLEVKLFTESGEQALDRLDVLPLPGGSEVLGYVLDFEEQALLYARLRRDVEVDPGQTYTMAQLPDALIRPQNLSLELQAIPGGSYVALAEGSDFILDYLSGVVTLTQSSSELVSKGTGATLTGTTLVDPDGTLVADGVQQGDVLLVRSGAAVGVYTIDTVGSDLLANLVETVTNPASSVAYKIWRGSETLVDRYWREIPPVDPNTKVERLVSLGSTQNSPRLSIPLGFINRTRFRFGTDRWATHVLLVSTFSPPASLQQGRVEILETTGELNFSSQDLGETVFWSRELVLGTDYSLQPPLGFIEFSERFLESEEAFLTYGYVGEDDSVTIIEERAAFLVRKEICTHTGSDRVTFNPLGRELAEAPTVEVFRGGRPQQVGIQVEVDLDSSTIIFQPDSQVTDALPHGNVLEPDENVYIDYYIHQAIGGERDVTVIQRPMAGVTIVIDDEATEFTLQGDRTSDFQADHLLQVDGSQVYMIGTVTYDSGDGVTTVTLAGGAFRDDFLNPPLVTTSGPTSLSSSPGNPTYFIAEVAAFTTTPRGSNLVRLVGDRASSYEQGTVIHFTGAGAYDYLLVEAAVYDPEMDWTELTLASNGYQQYEPGTHTLLRTVRPVLPTPTGSATTNLTPLLADPSPDDPVLPEPPVTVYRKIPGQVGEVLTAPEQYAIDDAGTVTLVDPLAVGESIELLYVGIQTVEAGRKLRATYVHGLVPTETNGLLDQTLKMTYQAYLPDTFYWRVDVMDAFRAELRDQYSSDATGSLPTAGPVLENSSEPRLYEQGRESVYFTERRLSNEDIVSRGTLVAYNDAINLVEDALQHADGRVVGDHDGRFLFDGSLVNPPRASFAAATNQIDDLIQLIPSVPAFLRAAAFVRAAYKAAPTSRFFPTQRNLFAEAAVSSPEIGDPIADIGYENLTGVGSVSDRLAWGVVTELAPIGQFYVYVDETGGLADLLRPSFSVGDRVAVISQSGSTIVSDASPLVVTGVPSSTRLNLSAPLTSEVPVGATVRHAIGDFTSGGGNVQPQQYPVGISVALNLELGMLTYFELLASFFSSTPPSPQDGDPLDFTGVGVPVPYTAPERFPALDGATTDDDGNRGFPILTPQIESEEGRGLGHLSIEYALLADILSHATEVYDSQGGLNGTGTVLTNLNGNWPNPQPAIGDLVRTLNGVNGLSTFRRIQAVGASTVTLIDTLAFDTGFDFQLVRGSTIAMGSGTVSGTILTDVTAAFQTNVRVGHTVVVYQSASSTRRRQVVAVLSQTQLQLSASTFSGVVTYRVTNAISTYGGAAGSETDRLAEALDGQLRVLRDNSSPKAQQPALEGFFDAVFTDVVPTGGSATVAGTDELSDPTRNFPALGVEGGHFVFIRSGSVAGTYQILEILDPNTLRVDRSFPTGATGVTYSIRETTLVTLASLQSIHEVLLRVDAAISSVGVFRSLVMTTVTVAGDSNAFALAWRGTDLVARQGVVSVRLNEVVSDVSTLEGALSSGDRLYDRRYTWIDARINLETGIIVRQERAVEKREKTLEEAKSQIIKLVTT